MAHVTIAAAVCAARVSSTFKMRVTVYAVFDDNKLFRLGSAILKGSVSTPEITFTLPGKPKQVLLCAMEDVPCTYTVRTKG